MIVVCDAFNFIEEEREEDEEGGGRGRRWYDEGSRRRGKLKRRRRRSKNISFLKKLGIMYNYLLDCNQNSRET